MARLRYAITKAYKALKRVGFSSRIAKAGANNVGKAKFKASKKKSYKKRRSFKSKFSFKKKRRMFKRKY